MRIIKVLSVTDTRDYIEDGDRWIPVSGTGNEHECARCGRIHEVHATVECEGGVTAVVGTGCMSSESIAVASKLRSMGERAKRIAALMAEEAVTASALEAQTKREGDIATIPAPPLVRGVKTMSDGTSFPTVSCGGVELWCRFGDRNSECVMSWRESLRGRTPAYMLRERLAEIRKRLASLTEKQKECATAHLNE